MEQLRIPISIINPIQIPSVGGKKINVLGIPMVIRIHGRDSSGAVAVVESHDVPGGGPPLHIHHREDETFQVLEGAMHTVPVTNRPVLCWTVVNRLSQFPYWSLSTRPQRAGQCASNKERKQTRRRAASTPARQALRQPRFAG